MLLWIDARVIDHDVDRTPTLRHFIQPCLKRGQIRKLQHLPAHRATPSGQGTSYVHDGRGAPGNDGSNSSLSKSTCNGKPDAVGAAGHKGCSFTGHSTVLLGSGISAAFLAAAVLGATRKTYVRVAVCD